MIFYHIAFTIMTLYHIQAEAILWRLFHFEPPLTPLSRLAPILRIVMPAQRPFQTSRFSPFLAISQLFSKGDGARLLAKSR